MIRTIVKTLTGDIFSIEHHRGALEQGLKDAINRVIPEFYSECQKIIYPEGGDKSECYVIVDTVKDTVGVEISDDNSTLIFEDEEQFMLWAVKFS